MSQLFNSARLKITGAKEELDDLKTGIKAFLECIPYKLIVERDPSGTKEFHKLVLTGTAPERLGLLTARIASELRDALDQAGYASALATGNASPKKAYFPICKKAGEFENCIKDNCKHIPPDIVSLFRTFNAYPGGDELLVALNNIAGGGKHCVIQPVAHATGQSFYKMVSAPIITGGFEARVPRWDTVKNEVILFVAGVGSQFQYQIHSTFFIAFGEVDFVRGQEVPTVFDTLVGKVEGIVNATEAELRRIGLIT